MIRKLIVLNGTEGHKFEVGKQYANSEVQIVKNINYTHSGTYDVEFELGDYVEVKANNVLVFHSLQIN